MVTKVDLRTNDTRQRILQEAKRLYLLGGYTHLSMDKIADILGLKRPTLYYHFPGGKEQLLVETINFVFNELNIAWSKAIAAGHDTRSKLRNILTTVVEHPMPENKIEILTELWQLGDEVKTAIKQVYAQIYNLLSQVFEEGIKKGEIKLVEVELLIMSFMASYDQVKTFIAVKQNFPELSPEISNFGLEVAIGKMFELWMTGLEK